MTDIRIKPNEMPGYSTVFARTEAGKRWLSEFTIVQVGLLPWCRVTDDAVTEYACAAREAGLVVECR